MKKILALVLAMMMVLTMGAAFAEGGDTPAATTEKVTITVTRDSSFAGTEESEGRAFTWYKVFTAVPADDFTSSNASGHNNGVANVATGNGKVSYYATKAVATALASEENVWFDVQAISGSDLSVVSWKEGVATDATTLQAAAKWLIENNAYEASGDMAYADSKWTAEVEKGYYVLSSDTGDNVIAATTDITVNEKNDYPPIKKEQKDEDKTSYATNELGVKIGDVLSYQVTVTIPKAAKVGETIEVYDKISEGLTYNNDVTANIAVTDGTSFTGDDIAWDKVITVTEANKGTDVIFTYTMTVNESALVDTGRVNEAGLKYGDEYDSIPQKVTYTTYFTGIHKTDGGDEEKKMAGVKFNLFRDGKAFNVTLNSEGGYYIPGGNSNEVVTDEDGYIYIRGLDNDKTYTLTEIETLPGYNMLEEDVTLVLVEDTPAVADDPATTDKDETKAASFDAYEADSYQNVENNTGSQLPSTGGIGTTIFYIAGTVLVLAAVVLLVTKRRMGADK